MWKPHPRQAHRAKLNLVVVLRGAQGLGGRIGNIVRGRRPHGLLKPVRSAPVIRLSRGQSEDMQGSHNYRSLSLSLVALGVALAVIAILGPLVLDVIRYRVSGRMLSQLRGADTVSLFVVAPLSLIIGLLAHRGHRAAPALALGPAAYTLYMVAEAIVGPDYVRTAGNDERFFPLLLATFVLAGAVALRAWSLIDPPGQARSCRGRERAVGGLLVGLGVFLVLGRYVPALADAMRARPSSADYLAGPTIFWTIALEDLGIVIPGLLVVGLGMWRGSQWAARASFVVVGWAALVPLAVAAMGVTMYLDRQPSASAASLGLLGGMAVVFMLPAAICYPPLFRAVSSPASSRAGSDEARQWKGAA